MRDDGGAIFPVLSRFTNPYSGEIGFDCVDPGMTLRNWLSGQVLTGYSMIFNGDIEPALAAEWCYRIADTMLAERKRKKEAGT